jgi:chaperone modulatory protein CbpM
MREDEILTGALLEEACLTLEELARACAVSTDWVLRHMEEGCLEALEGAQSEWRFSSRDLRRVRNIRALERDYDAVPELAALVADLMEELEQLRVRLRRAGLE